MGWGREEEKGGLALPYFSGVEVLCLVNAHAASSLTCPAMFLQGMLRHKF